MKFNTGRKFQNTLNRVEKKPKSKSNIHIASVNDNLTLTKNGKDLEVDNLLKNTNNIDLMCKLDSLSPTKDQTTMSPTTPSCLSTPLKPKLKSKSKSIDFRTCLVQDDKLHLPTIDYNLKSILNEDTKIKEVQKKYAKQRPNFNPTLLSSQEDINSTIISYSSLLLDIMNGSKPSYFYTLAKRIQKSTNNNIITNDQLIALPKTCYYGYIGSKRAALLSRVILENDQLKQMLNKIDKSNKVVQFWGLNHLFNTFFVQKLLLT